MSNVIPLRAPKNDQPHASGECVCRHCKHEWVGVAPVGTPQLECPQCHTEHGYFKYPFAGRAGDSEYLCHCGSKDFFIVLPGGSLVVEVRCRHCGVSATCFE